MHLNEFRLLKPGQESNFIRHLTILWGNYMNYGFYNFIVQTMKALEKRKSFLKHLFRHIEG